MPPDDLLTTAQVRQMLGISKQKMAHLIASGELHTQPDPLDGRVKLIRRSEVDALLARSSKLERAA
jgi:excisionase family DNA binding protein